MMSYHVIKRFLFKDKIISNDTIKYYLYIQLYTKKYMYITLFFN